MQLDVTKDLRLGRTKRLRWRKVLKRTVLVGAWLVFWINALLYPCMDAAAALSRNDCGVGVGVLAPMPAANHLQKLHADDNVPILDPLCCHVLNSVPSTLDVGPGFTLNHQLGNELPVAVTGLAQLITPTRFGSLAYREIPPPRAPLYLRTSRLLN